MAKRNDKRRYILSQSEINELYCLPRLNNVQREQCFSLTDEELSAVNQQFLLGSKLYFILLLGYFREKPVIAQFHFGEVKEDLKYVIDRYYPGQRLPRKDPSQSQVYYLRKKLLDRLHYRNLDGKLKINLGLLSATKILKRYSIVKTITQTNSIDCIIVRVCGFKFGIVSMENVMIESNIKV